MENILTEEDKKILRFIANRYLPSLGMDFGSIDLSVDDWDSEISVRRLDHFSNNYIAEIPEQLVSIIQKIIDYSNEVIEKPDVEDLNYQSADINISVKDQKITLTYDWYYYEEGDSEGSYWSSDEDEDAKEIINQLKLKYPNERVLLLTYNGSGDSGSIDGRFQSGPEVPDDVESWCYSSLENSHGGWEINEGSFGEFTFDLENGTIELSHTNNIESNDSAILFEESFAK